MRVVQKLAFNRPPQIVGIEGFEDSRKNKALVCVCILICPVRKLGKGVRLIVVN